MAEGRERESSDVIYNPIDYESGPITRGTNCNPPRVEDAVQFGQMQLVRLGIVLSCGHCVGGRYDLTGLELY